MTDRHDFLVGNCFFFCNFFPFSLTLSFCLIADMQKRLRNGLEKCQNIKAINREREKDKRQRRFKLIFKLRCPSSGLIIAPCKRIIECIPHLSFLCHFSANGSAVSFYLFFWQIIFLFFFFFFKIEAKID
jgi:hypothetical protein